MRITRINEEMTVVRAGGNRANCCGFIGDGLNGRTIII